jgi:hypothetical protein
MTTKRKTGLAMFNVDLSKEGKMSKETLRYFIENRIDPYAADVREIRKRYK